MSLHLTDKVGAQELENWLATQLDPRIDFKIISLSYEEKSIFIFRIDATRTRPVSFKGIEFIRVGSCTKKLKEHPEVERNIWEKASKKRFENRFAINKLTIDEAINLIDYPGYFNLTEQPLPTNKESIVSKLIEEKLLAEETQKNTYAITNLGAILFAKDLRKFDSLKRKAVRVVIYKGKDRLNTIKQQEGCKGYAVGFKGLISFISDQLPSEEKIEEALREEVHSYPPIAIRELVANMLIHQDFDTIGTGPFVEIFSDRVEISNPGKPLIDTLRFLDHNPISRNEQLAYFMRRMKICEERGSGVDKIVSSCEISNLPAPNFQKEDKYFKATLFGPRSIKQMTKKDKIRATYLHCALKFICSENMTNSSLRARFGINDSNYPQASRIIKDTIDTELIKPSDPSNKAPKHASYIPFWA